MIGLLQTPYVIRHGARMALLAVLLHLALSFAHVHPLTSEPYFGGPPGAAQPSPDAPTSTPAVDDSCAICANITAFGTLAMPVPMVLARLMFRRVILFAPPPFARAGPAPFGNFLSRAPPAP